MDVDNQTGARLAVEHLLAQGHQRIGCITNFPTTAHDPNLRMLGYQAALRNADRPLIPACWLRVFTSRRAASTAMQQLLDQPQPPAVFVASDVMAIGTLTAIYPAGADGAQGYRCGRV